MHGITNVYLLLNLIVICSIGCIILNYLPFAIVSGIIVRKEKGAGCHGGSSVHVQLQVAGCGLAYIVLHFVPRIEPPSNMRREALDEQQGGRTSRWVEGGSH